MPVTNAVVRVSLCLVFLMCSSAVCMADADPARAKALFQEAKVLHEKGEVRASLERLEEAWAAFPANGILVSIANRHLDLGEPEEAAAALSRITKPSRTMRRQVTRLQRDIERQLALPVSVVIDANADNSVVSIDEGPARELPLSIQLTRGNHRFRFKAPGYRDTVKVVEVRGSREVRIDAVLPRPMGKFRVNIEPPEPLQRTRILVDGKLLELSAAERAATVTLPRELLPGSYRVSCLRGVDESTDALLELRSGGLSTVTCVFDASGGGLTRAMAWTSAGASLVSLGVGTAMLVSYLDDKATYPEPRYKLESSKPLAAGLLYATGLGLGVLSYFLFTAD